MNIEITKPLKLFYVCVDQDTELREQLENHLVGLERQGRIIGWHPQKMVAGANTYQITNEQFLSSQIILLLISPESLASPTTYTQMCQALERSKANRVHVIPVLLRPVDWESTGLADLQPLPRNGRAVTLWRERDLAFASIVKDIHLLLEQLYTPFAHSMQQPTRMATPFPHIFLSYARTDRSLAEHLKNDLRTHNIVGWIDHQTFQPGNPEGEDELQEALRNASSVILIVSSHTRRSRPVKGELRIAEMYQRPIYVFWMQGQQLDEVIPIDWKHLPSFDAREERYAQAFQHLLQTFRHQAPGVFLLDTPARSIATLEEPPRNPFKGLKAFHEEDAQDFFGRDGLVQDLLVHIKEMLVGEQSREPVSRLLTILGPSGSGKSSVVMAGLLFKLKHGALPGSQHWVYLDPMTPGSHPINNLISVLAPFFPARSRKSLREDLEDDSEPGLHILLTALVKQVRTKVILLIDQFEELFTQTIGEEVRSRFLDMVLTAVTEPSGSLMALITLRADFYDRPLQYPELGHLIEAHHEIAYPLEIRDLRAIIERPAQLDDVQLTFEEDLVGDLLFEMQGQGGALPLLQFTLDQLFHRRQGRLLTRSAYDEMGGVRGALAKHAEETYQLLPTQSHQQLTRALFLRLINPGTMEQDATKCRVALTQLMINDSEKAVQLKVVTDIFIEARLLTTNRIGDVPTIEVSHETLIHAWARLEEWFHEGREDIRFQQVLSEVVTGWQGQGQPTDLLYSGSHLKRALQWRKANLVSCDEECFLQASIEYERQQHRVRTRRTLLMSGVGLAGMVITGFAVNALREHISSPIQASTPLPRNLPYTYGGHTAAVRCVAWSPDGRYLASAGDDNVQVSDAESGIHLLTYTGHTASVYCVSWSPDSKRLASGGDDKMVHVWDAKSGNRLLTYTGHVGREVFITVTGVAWSLDGNRILSTATDSTVQVWDAHTATRFFIFNWSAFSALSVAWSPNGKYLAAGGYDHVQIWDAKSGSSLLTYAGHATDEIGTVSSIAWSPDGTRLASGGYDTTVQVWDAKSGNRLLTYTGHNNTVNCVSWSPDSRFLASGGVDTTVQVWDAKSGIHPLTYSGHTSPVTSVVWSPHGRILASAGGDKTVQVWSVNNAISPLPTKVPTCNSIFCSAQHE